jgi:hypothetical protein
MKGNSPSEEHNNFIHSKIFKWNVKFGIGINEPIKESFDFPKSVTVIVWFVHIVTKI